MSLGICHRIEFANFSNRNHTIILRGNSFSSLYLDNPGARFHVRVHNLGNKGFYSTVAIPNCDHHTLPQSHQVNSQPPREWAFIKLQKILHQTNMAICAKLFGGDFVNPIEFWSTPSLSLPRQPQTHQALNIICHTICIYGFCVEISMLLFGKIFYDIALHIYTPSKEVYHPPYLLSKNPYAFVPILSQKQREIFSMDKCTTLSIKRFFFTHALVCPRMGQKLINFEGLRKSIEHTAQAYGRDKMAKDRNWAREQEREGERMRIKIPSGPLFRNFQ